MALSDRWVCRYRGRYWGNSGHLARAPKRRE
jgi:hypothetical protein